MREPYSGIKEQYMESLDYFDSSNIVGCFLQGSQNYELSTPNSDIDSKLIVVPTFREIAMNEKPISTTHIHKNNEHTDFKDIRLYIDSFRKQNINSLEILFTKYFIINPSYESQWNRLIEAREEIARMNPIRGFEAMRGVAFQKYKDMYHPTASRQAAFEKYGYDPKSLHHLVRIGDFMNRSLRGDSYEECLTPENKDYLIKLKMGELTAPHAKVVAETALDVIDGHLSRALVKWGDAGENEEMCNLLYDVQYEIMKIAMKKELSK